MLRARAFLRHPLFIMVATLATTVVFADRIAQVSGDRQRELDLKQRLLTQIADSSTRTVSSAREAARTADSTDRRKDVYSNQSGAWLVASSLVTSQLQVYFDDDVGSEWEAFARTVDDFIRVAALLPRNSDRGAASQRLREDLTAGWRDERASRLATQVDWDCVEGRPRGCFFYDDLALVGQLILLRRAQLDRRVLAEPANGFAQRVFPPW